MARVTTTTNSRKPHTCGRGGHEIPKGESYYSAAPGFRGATLYRCMKHPFKPSELTTSMRGEALAAIEDFEEAASEATTVEELSSALEDLKGAIGDYADQRQDALDQWENGNSQLEELNDIAEEARSTVDMLDVEPFDGDDPDEDSTDEQREAYEEHVNEQRETLLDEVGGLEV